MLVMYNRYHNYAATQLRRINENGRFSVPTPYRGSKLAATASKFVKDKNKEFHDIVKYHEEAWEKYNADGQKTNESYEEATESLQKLIDRAGPKSEDIQKFHQEYDAAWNKLDDDIFNTARL